MFTSGGIAPTKLRSLGGAHLSEVRALAAVRNGYVMALNFSYRFALGGVTYKTAINRSGGLVVSYASTGKIRWVHPLTANDVTLLGLATTSRGDALVVVSTGRSTRTTLRKLSTGSGKQLWSVPIGSSFGAGPVLLSGGVAVVAAHAPPNVDLLAFDKAGQRKWKHSLRPNKRDRVVLTALAADSNGQRLVATAFRQASPAGRHLSQWFVASVSKNGKPLFETTFVDDIELAGAAVVGSSSVVAATFGRAITVNGNRASPNGMHDMLLMPLGPQGKVKALVSIGGLGDDKTRSLKLVNNRLYLEGSSTSSSYTSTKSRTRVLLELDSTTLELRSLIRFIGPRQAPYSTFAITEQPGGHLLLGGGFGGTMKVGSHSVTTSKYQTGFLATLAPCRK